MEGVFANRSEKRDFVINELERRATDECSVYIASAFFTHSAPGPHLPNDFRSEPRPKGCASPCAGFSGSAD